MSLPDAATAQRHAADAWDAGDAYEAYMGRWSRPVAARFVEWLRIPPGGVWLDVGCGTGALTAAICDAADPMAVTAVDPSPAFIAHAAQLPNAQAASFVEADGMALPFEDGLFDVVVSGLALNFLPDPTAALREQSRVAAGNGTIAAYVWDYAGGMRLLRHFWDVARRVSPSAAALDEAVRFRAANPRGLERTFTAAGLDPLETTSFEVESVFVDFEEVWAPFEQGQGPAPGFVAGLSTADRASLRAGLQAALPTADDGSISLAARAWAIRARP